MRIGIHVFRKDLRVVDNYALNQLSQVVDKVIGVFIFDSKQFFVTPSNKAYYSPRAAQFILDSVHDLNQQCDEKLLMLSGDPIVCIESLLKIIQPQTLSFNADFTAYALKRDKEIVSLCDRFNVECIINEDDQSILPLCNITKQDSSAYMVFGPFYKLCAKQKPQQIMKRKVTWTKAKHFKNAHINSIENNFLTGGRKEALKRLNKLQNLPSSDNISNETSHLSPYLNCGCISVREVYWSFKTKQFDEDAIRSLTWRDFFLSIFKNQPYANSYTRHIDDRYDKVDWPSVNKHEWNKFIKSETGFVLIDAIMKELQQTGYINNRCRLILGVFWIRYMLISPLNKQYGSQVWFSKLLIDCSASQNKLNHQWLIGDLDLSGRRFAQKGSSALTGRMMRIDNDMIKKFDPEYKYIKRWMTEYAELSVKECKAYTKTIQTMFDWKQRYQQYAKLFKKI